MRYLAAVVLPLILQLLGFAIVLVASQGGGSFVGLLALSVAVIAIPLLLIVGFIGAAGARPLGGLVATQLAIAIVPTILLLGLRALES